VKETAGQCGWNVECMKGLRGEEDVALKAVKELG